MRKFIENVKSVITKRSFLAKLSEEYGNPGEMRDYLLTLTKESPWMLIFFGKDINRLDEEAQAALAETEEADEERRMELEYEAQNPCFSCPLGNGMGRCGTQLPLDCEAADRI